MIDLDVSGDLDFARGSLRLRAHPYTAAVPSSIMRRRGGDALTGVVLPLCFFTSKKKETRPVQATTKLEGTRRSQTLLNCFDIIPTNSTCPGRRIKAKSFLRAGKGGEFWDFVWAPVPLLLDTSSQSVGYICSFVVLWSCGYDRFLGCW